MVDRRAATGNDAEVEASAPWLDQPGDAGPAPRWAHYRDWIWSAVIVVVVMGLGIWNVVAHGPIHPHA